MGRKRRSSAGIWMVLVATVAAVLLCSGVWTPTTTVLAGTAWAAATWAWVALTGVAVLLGPGLLMWMVLRGPPARGDRREAWTSAFMGIAGLALVLAVLRYSPLLMLLGALLLALPFLGA